MVFYGLTFASATLKLAGSVYLNFTLNVLVEFGASFIAFLFIDKFGRRPFMIGTQLLSGICVLIAGHMGNIQVNCNELHIFFTSSAKILLS
jgi:MFS family permease